MTRAAVADMLSGRIVAGDPEAAASSAALQYVMDDEAGIGRARSGKGFRYADAKGRVVRDAATLSRIRALAIPPAWTKVWIEPVVARYLDKARRKQRA